MIGGLAIDHQGAGDHSHALSQLCLYLLRLLNDSWDGPAGDLDDRGVLPPIRALGLGADFRQSSNLSDGHFA